MRYPILCLLLTASSAFAAEEVLRVGPCSRLTVGAPVGARVEARLDGGVLAPAGGAIAAPREGDRWLAVSVRAGDGAAAVSWLRLSVDASAEPAAGTVRVSRREVAGVSVVEWAVGCSARPTVGAEYVFVPGEGVASLSGRFDEARLGPARQISVLLRTPGAHRLEMSAVDAAGRSYPAQWQLDVRAADGAK